MRLMADLGAGHGDVDAFADALSSRQFNEWIAEYTIRGEEQEEEHLKAAALAGQASRPKRRRR